METPRWILLDGNSRPGLLGLNRLNFVISFNNKNISFNKNIPFSKKISFNKNISLDGNISFNNKKVSDNNNSLS
jgi:hypothetical protein